MGNRDTRRRESKKPKKDEKKVEALTPISTSPSVQVVPKRKAPKEPRE